MRTRWMFAGFVVAGSIVVAGQALPGFTPSSGNATSVDTYHTNNERGFAAPFFFILPSQRMTFSAS